MISIRAYRCAGKCHGNGEYVCQDVYNQVKSNNKGVITLCDGAGGFLYGKEAAEIVSKIMTHLLFRNFEKYMIDDGRVIINEIAYKIDKLLKKYAKINKINVCELATTIMAAAIDIDGRFIAFHLGDGAIVWNEKTGERNQLVSSPQNGFNEHSTFLTMNCNLKQNLHFYRWNKPEAKRIILYTDGAKCLNKYYDSEIFEIRNERLLQKVLHDKAMNDDCSYILVEID